MRINERSGRVIRAAALQADASIKAVSKIAGFREHVVRYELDRLIEAGVLNRTAFIDLYPLGYNIYDIFFSIGSQKKDIKEAFLRTLMEAPQVTFLAEIGGEYQYDIGICCKHNAQVNIFLEDISRKFKNIILKKLYRLDYDLLSLLENISLQ